MSLFSIFKKKKEPVRFIAKTPLTWWIDDVECRVCALVDHPTLGLDKLPWPDCDKVYLAVDKTAYDKIEQENKMMQECIEFVIANSGTSTDYNLKCRECLNKLTKDER
jgi:hypothetical protein